MINYSDIEYDFCKKQGAIYKLAAREGYDMKNFSDVYLKSDFCERAFDTIYSRFQMADEEESFDFIVPENEDKLIKLDNKWFNQDVSWWIGFTYRYLYYDTGLTSKELSDRVPFEKLVAMYAGLHTIEEQQAADIINESLDLPNNPRPLESETLER